jgi:Fe-S cluster assembly protein SufB
MATPKPQVNINEEYERLYGFHVPERSVFKAEPGLDEAKVKQISGMKDEPQWMTDIRLRAYRYFTAKPMPQWANTELLNSIRFDDIYYYLKPTEKKSESWEDVPPEIKQTFDRLGIPEAERKFLAGVSAQYDSEAVYHSMRKDLEKMGVVFFDMDTGLKEHPEIVKRYFGTVIPPADNKFAALNTAVWSGGSFIFVPKGMKVEMPLQAYFRINAKNMGQFERTLIIADEGAEVTYIEGCFTKGALVTTNPDYKPIEDIKVGERVLTHTGGYRRVYHTQERPYSGPLYTIEVYGDATQRLEVTEEHPFLYVKRERANERNHRWDVQWGTPRDLHRMDYLAVPVNRIVESVPSFKVSVPFRRQIEVAELPSTPAFFRLAGYFLAEGSVNKRGYLCFAFGETEREWIDDVKRLLRDTLGVTKVDEFLHHQNHGISLVVSSARLARAFRQLFGESAATRRIPQWMMLETPEKQRELILGVFRGDGNYYNRRNTHGRKELFRLSTVSPVLARQLRDVLLRLGIVAFLNKRERRHEGRQAMFIIGIGGEFARPFGRLVGVPVQGALNGKKRATMFAIDSRYAYIPIKRITARVVEDVPVYNFSVEGDESYVAGGVAVHNCTAPSYSSDSLHSAVVELIAMPHARLRYVTIQNWSKNVYNLVTKRAVAHEGATVEWLDCNMGCLAADAQLFLNPRGPVAIKDVQPNDYIYAIDLDTLKPQRFRVAATQCTGVRKTYRLVTDNYRELKATDNHPFLVMDRPPLSSLTRLEWRPLSALRPGDRIAIAAGMPDEGKPKRFGYVYPPLKKRGSLKHRPTIPEESTDELMWLLGLYLGDGYVERENATGRLGRVFFAVPEHDRARARLEQAIQDIFHVAWKPKGLCVTVNSMVLSHFILSMGFTGRAKEKRVPPWVFGLPLSQKLSFIEGYMDADGFVRQQKVVGDREYGQIVFASAHKALLEDVKLLLIHCGLNPLKIAEYVKARTLYKGRLKEYRCYYLSMNIRESLEAIRSKRVMRAGLDFVPVRSIEPLGEEPVYDIEVEGARNFIANGIVVHNSRLTMKYPGVYMMGRGARGEVLSVAFASDGQHQDAGAKMIHAAPDTSSVITSKSVSKGAGRTSYRGLVKVYPGAANAKSTVRCDALLLNEESRSDTYPTMEIDEKRVQIGHEATVSKIGDEQLFYAMSRGLKEQEAMSMIVNGFIEPFVKALPLEYAVEMNRLVQLEMEGAVG